MPQEEQAEQEQALSQNGALRAVAFCPSACSLAPVQVPSSASRHVPSHTNTV